MSESFTPPRPRAKEELTENAIAHIRKILPDVLKNPALCEDVLIGLEMARRVLVAEARATKLERELVMARARIAELQLAALDDGGVDRTGASR